MQLQGDHTKPIDLALVLDCEKVGSGGQPWMVLVLCNLRVTIAVLRFPLPKVPFSPPSFQITEYLNAQETAKSARVSVTSER